MGSVTPDPKRRGYLLPPGCKDLIHVLQGAPPKLSFEVPQKPFPPKPPPPKPWLGVKAHVNSQIRAREVRVIGHNGEQIGIMPLAGALRLARSRKLDLVEVAPHAKPPVCRLVDYGKFQKLSRKGKKHK